VSTERLLKLARERAAAARRLEEADELLMREAAEAVKAGGEVNISRLAEEAALSRQTVYSRLAELGVDR